MELHDTEEAMGIRNILAYDIRMKKNPQTKEDTFKEDTCTPARKFYQWRR